MSSLYSGYNGALSCPATVPRFPGDLAKLVPGYLAKLGSCKNFDARLEEVLSEVARRFGDASGVPALVKALSKKEVCAGVGELERLVVDRWARVKAARDACDAVAMAHFSGIVWEMTTGMKEPAPLFFAVAVSSRNVQRFLIEFSRTFFNFFPSTIFGFRLNLVQFCPTRFHWYDHSHGL
jgi:hypothetical protein